MEVNNNRSASTAYYRTSATIRHDDFLGRGDSLSLSAQTAPERTDDGTVWSGNYLTRLGQGAQLMVYGLRSDSDIAVVGGHQRDRRRQSGGGAIHPLARGVGRLLSRPDACVDWKDFAEDVTLGADRASAPIQYFPSWPLGAATGRARAQQRPQRLGRVRSAGPGDGWERFDAKRYKARPSFVALKLDGSHTEDLAYDLQLSTRFTGQCRRTR